MQMDAGRFREHILQTYFTLRASMGVTALAFPVVLALGGWAVFALPYQASLSDYYYTPLGDVFVGMLIAIGASLTVYRGYSPREDWILNLAGILAVGVALIPPERVFETVEAAAGLDALTRGGPLFSSSFLHGACALSFFAAIGWVCIFHAKDTLELIPVPIVVRRYKQLYRLIGSLMIAAPVGAGVLSAVIDSGRMLFWAEAFAVWVFAAYWLTKTYELRRSRGDQKLMNPPEA